MEMVGTDILVSVVLDVIKAGRIEHGEEVCHTFSSSRVN